MSDDASEISEHLDDSDDYADDFESSFASSREEKRNQTKANAYASKYALVGQQQQKTVSSYAVQHVTPPPPILKPQTGPKLQTLQSSLALEEIGKEVIKLRNERMQMFKERIIVANEKKDRALSRRLKYENDMKEKDDHISELKQKNSAMNLTNDSKGKEIEMLNAECKEVRERLSECESANEGLEKEIRTLKTKMKELEVSVKTTAEQLETATEDHEKQKNALLDQLKKSEICLEVLRVSNELSEKRFETERAQLPALQEQMIKDKIRLLTEQEALLAIREQRLVADETRKMEAFEKMQKDLLQEIQNQRYRSDEATEKEKILIQEQVRALREEKAEFAKFQSQIRNSMQVKQLELSRKENAIQATEQELKRRETELEISLNSMEPQFKALKYETEQVNSYKKDAEAYWEKVRKQADSVLFAESEIIAKEREMFSFADQIKARRSELTAMRDEVFEALKLVDEKQKILQSERFSFYDCAMSISTELTNIRKSVAVFDQILSDSTSATGEFRQQDSVKKIERMQSKIDSVIKILAEKIAPAPIVLNDLNRRRLLNLEDVPGIQIKIPSFSPQGSPNDVTSSNSILDHYTQKDAVDPLVSLLKANPVEENLKLSIEMASSSLNSMKEIGLKFGITF